MLLSRIYYEKTIPQQICTPMFRTDTPVAQHAHTVSSERLTPVGRNLQGYGKELLKLLLEKANESGIDKVLITIHKENVASRAVAEANGAILEKETEDRAYYWIESGR